MGGGNDILGGLSWCFAWLDPARVAFFVAAGLAGEIMALTKKQKARRAAIIKILTELSPNGWAKRGPGPLRIGLPACECSLTQGRHGRYERSQMITRASIAVQHRTGWSRSG
jgi:hypothetical protein